MIMLRFTKNDKYYIITATSYTAIKTTVNIIRYAKDLTHKQLNDEPLRQTTNNDVEWFNKHYLHHYQHMNLIDVNIMLHDKIIEKQVVALSLKHKAYYITIDRTVLKDVPDTDELYLEDNDGFRYRHIITPYNDPILTFKMI